MDETHFSKAALEAINHNTVIRVRCPACMHQGALTSPPGHELRRSETPNVRYLVRQCPNPDCGLIMFVVAGTGGEALFAYPPETLDFDATNLPETVLEALSESVQCHAAHCYRASAMMVRRTLEVICEDRGAAGRNLKERLDSMRSTAGVSKDLVDGLDTLRLLGNDAAHVELKDFEDIGEREARLGIAIAKELAKTIYQHRSLVAELDALRKDRAQPSEIES